MKSYKQYCGVAMALDLVGQRWTLLIVRELLPGPRRFTDLRLVGLTPNVLSDRLRHMREAGLIERRDLPAPAARTVWALTPLGRELEPVVLALGGFGAQYLTDPTGYTLSPRWMMVSLHRRYRGGCPDGIVHLTLGEHPYSVAITPKAITIRDGHTGTATASLSGPVAPMMAVVGRGHAVGGELTVTGDVDALNQWLDCLTPMS